MRPQVSSGRSSPSTKTANNIAADQKREEVAAAAAAASAAAAAASWSVGRPLGQAGRQAGGQASGFALYSCCHYFTSSRVSGHKPRNFLDSVSSLSEQLVSMCADSLQIESANQLATSQ